MPEYVGSKPKAVAPDAPVLIDNRCENPVEVGAGLVFREDGDYTVSVRDGKITVRGIDALPKEREAIKPEIVPVSGIGYYYACANCKKPLRTGDKYCCECGMGVAWE